MGTSRCSVGRNRRSARSYDDFKAIVAAAVLPKGTKPPVPKHFRSTCGSALIANGSPTVAAKEWLIHASVETTANFYLNTSTEVLRAAAARRDGCEAGRLFSARLASAGKLALQCDEPAPKMGEVGPPYL